MKNKLKLNTIHKIILIIGTIFIFASVFHSNIWFDEAYSVGIADHTIIDIWKIGGHDVHPVLYYWMLRIVNLITNGSIFAYRLFSALPIALLGLLGYTHIKKDFGEKTGLLFSFFSYFLPIMAVYANQIRMYSWAIYIVTVLAIYTYRIYLGENTIKNWTIFGVTSLASIFIHYYGLMAAGLINVFLLLYLLKNKKWKQLGIQIGLGIIQIACYIPWLISLLAQMKHVSGGFWIGFEFPRSMLELIGCHMQIGTKMADMPNLWAGFVITILLWILLAVILIKTRKTENYKPVYQGVGIYLAVILGAIVVTKVIGSPILYYRYLFVITGLYIFAISYILSKTKHTFIIISICTIIAILGIINTVMQAQENYSLENGKQIAYLQEHIQDGDVLVYSNIGNGSIFACYFKNNHQYFYNGANWGVEEAYKAWAPQMETYITTDFLEKCRERIWIIDSQDDGFYNELFHNEDFKFVSTEKFVTPYQNYIYNITLVERIR